jgi:hypothetical protein
MKLNLEKSLGVLLFTIVSFVFILAKLRFINIPLDRDEGKLGTHLYLSSKADNIYQNLYLDNPNYNLKSFIKVLKRKLKKDDKIYVFESNPQVYYQTSSILSIPHIYVSSAFGRPSERDKKINKKSSTTFRKTSKVPNRCP